MQLHGQLNNSVLASKTTRNNLHKLTSLYDLSLFNLNTNLAVNLNPYENLSTNQFRSRYFSPHSFAQMQSKLSKNKRLSSFSVFHNNVLSINKNLENLQTQILEELEFQFDIIGICETKITNSNAVISVPTIPGCNFESVPTPLALGGVALFMDDRHGYRFLEEASNEAFQASWIEILFVVLFTGSTTHWNVFRNTLKKQSRSLLLWVSRFAFSVILTSTF